MEPRHGRLASLTVAILMIVGIGASLPAAPAEARTLLLVFPPWWSRGDIWQAALATGEIVTDVSSFALVLHSDEDGFTGRARRAGAILVLDPGDLASCGGRPEGRI